MKYSNVTQQIYSKVQKKDFTNIHYSDIMAIK